MNLNLLNIFKIKLIFLWVHEILSLSETSTCFSGDRHTWSETDLPVETAVQTETITFFKDTYFYTSFAYLYWNNVMNKACRLSVSDGSLIMHDSLRSSMSVSDGSLMRHVGLWWSMLVSDGSLIKHVEVSEGSRLRHIGLWWVSKRYW